MNNQEHRTKALSIAIAAVALSVFANDALAAKPCARKKFDTQDVKAACAKGGQDEAKKQQKEFVKQAKHKNPDMGCATCHTKVGGDYPLKPDGLKRYLDNGGH